MQVEALMARGIYDAAAEQDLRDAARTMRARRTSYLLVREGGVVVGGLSAGDVIDAYAEGLTDTGSVKVKDVMDPEVPGLHATTTVERAVALMRDAKTAHAAVLDDRGAPIGIVTFGDLTLRGKPSTPTV